MKKKDKSFSNGEIVCLSELKIGSGAEIIQIDIENQLVKRRLFELGIVSGTIVEIKKFAPLGDPVIVKVRGVELCLRKNELEKIIAKVVK